MKYVILADIRSAHNVGSIFRTADGAGVSEIFLAGYTPAPQDRFGRVVEEIRKTSLGASETVKWSHEPDVLACIANLKESGITVVAVEQSIRSVSLYDFTEPPAVAYVFGNEVAGINESVLNACDSILELPMKGRKESLNVSVAAGIVLFHHPL